VPLERDETDIAHFPRLVFRFNRRNLGRLRLLIDAINRGSVEWACLAVTKGPTSAAFRPKRSFDIGDC
jgi:hypothetical protein